MTTRAEFAQQIAEQARRVGDNFTFAQIEDPKVAQRIRVNAEVYSTNKRHIWAQTTDADDNLSEPIALCGARYDGRHIATGANANLPVCDLCQTLARQQGLRVH